MPEGRGQRSWHVSVTAGTCWRPSAEESKQVKKPSPAPAYICDECIDLCNDPRGEWLRPATSSSTSCPPAEIHDFLDQYVIMRTPPSGIFGRGHNHYKRIQSEAKGTKDSKDEPVELAKSNILMLGPTGCGKTYLAQTLAKMLNVPFAIADATALTEAGYVGEDVENILLKLIQSADYDVKRAETGIIYIDEVDKIARKSETRRSPGTSPVRAQQALLKILEGTVASVPRRAAASTRTRSSSRSTPPTSCSSSRVPSPAWRRSSKSASASTASASAPSCGPRPMWTPRTTC